MPEKQGYSVKKMVYAALFAALTGVGSWIAIPLPYVSVTLQTLFTILSGAVLGPYFGALSMIVYVLLGLIGLPVFSRGQSGLGVLFGPSGGYLIGFVLAAIAIGLIVKMKEKPGYWWYCLALAIGIVIIDLFGVAQLAIITGLPLDKAVLVGALVFVPTDILKVLIGAYIAKKIQL
ncbi:biotin transporter BioY [Methanocella sp. MCL-LM]|uniref:biotin transporter BioY n=1 Tax=Methanocella sp. MCL-LM TaxID=3412035 RepID=UPI003C72E108